MKTNFHEDFYSFAKYYDIAFDFKNIPKECNFIESLYQKYTSNKPASFIEIAAGPALHAIEFGKRKVEVAAIDLSSEMVTYGLKKARDAGVSLNYECADMVHFQMARKYDIASILMDSTSYLLTNEQVIQHLRSMSEILNPGGLYILEMSHPRSVFQISQSTLNEWEMKKEGISVKVQWGHHNDQFDPISQLTDVSVRLEYTDGENTGIIENKAPQRCFTATEVDALVRASGRFEILEWFGAMDMATPFTNKEEAWRMIPVLQVKLE